MLFFDNLLLMHLLNYSFSLLLYHCSFNLKLSLITRTPVICFQTKIVSEVLFQR